MEGCDVDSQGILIWLTQGVTVCLNAPEHDVVDSQQGLDFAESGRIKRTIGRLLSEDALSGYCGFIGLLSGTLI